MILIGIDPSLNSTALTIYKENKYFFYNYTNNKPKYKWIKEVYDFVNFKFHEYSNNDDFSESETDKISIYDEVTDKVVDDIFNFIKDEETKIFIEGYSYSAQAGRLIDLVTFSTLLRYKLLKNKNITLHFIPPSSLKKYVATMVYKPDKKGVYRDENGKAGGSFDKKDMMNVLLHFDINELYFNYLKSNKNEILKSKNIPKPFDDINDSLLLLLHGLNVYNVLI
jgi:hypothetical protein